jgi:hypothetical protein
VLSSFPDDGETSIDDDKIDPACDGLMILLQLSSPFISPLTWTAITSSRPSSHIDLVMVMLDVTDYSPNDAVSQVDRSFEYRRHAGIA